MSAIFDWVREHKILTSLALLVLAVLIFRVSLVNFVDNYETGFVYNRFTGQVEILNRTGYFLYMPFKYSVHAIDLRPYQISITADIGGTSQGSSSVSKRVLNAKLVRFNPDGIMTFIAWHGRDAGDNLSNLLEIMKCYAFDKEDGKDCPFITVLSEINPSQAETNQDLPSVGPPK